MEPDKIDIIGDFGNPEKVAAAFEPVIQRAITAAIDQMTAKLVPALRDAVIDSLNGMTISKSNKG